MKIDRAEMLDTLSNPDKLRNLLNYNQPLKASSSPTDSTEQKLSDWLGRLKLLHGVPFNYLVPDMEMLPMESIRFFHCDTTWLSYLADGALSIGRTASSDYTHDEVHLPKLKLFARKSLKSERGKALGHLSIHLNKKESGLLNAEPNKASETITGFLLRSGVVKDWEGMQVAAFGANDVPCQLLRMDHLSPNVLLCMYEGIVNRIRINEHPEVLHFGFEKSETLQKSFRNLADKGVGQEPGTQIDEKVIKPIVLNPRDEKLSYMRAGNTGVIRINKLAAGMQDALNKGVDYKDSFTAAEFALEMVAGAEAVNFIIK
ncbi:hypothetical protein [Pedobacter sp. D749]|uniref:hypothetical protein n=1 Tax=Pedobacter sp. D749 TaxID=2856523 RepID=UPI001C5602F6|nr:hypothetical protein [Pedobacter sp. D749]QXU43437.1 hypothetical protein KYH19_07595 [Pedobacter sp. D749]